MNLKFKKEAFESDQQKKRTKTIKENTGTQVTQISGLYLGSHYHISRYFGSLKTNLNSENVHHPPVLSKSAKKLQNPENRQELRFHFQNRYITTFVHLGHLIFTYLYLLNMILTSIKIHNTQVLKKSCVKSLKTGKIWISCNESNMFWDCTLKPPHFPVLRFAESNFGATEACSHPFWENRL